MDVMLVNNDFVLVLAQCCTLDNKGFKDLYRVSWKLRPAFFPSMMFELVCARQHD